MLRALTRAPSASLGECVLTHIERVVVDVVRAREQHTAYLRVLESLGVSVTTLSAEDELPDAVFVEDAAVVLDELALIARPGVEVRQRETASIARALAAWRPLHHMRTPATLDGGDVLRLDRYILVGVSGRTNAEGRTQLRALVEPLGYTVTEVGVSGCLHLKSAVGDLGDGALLVNRSWIDASSLDGFALVDVPASEPRAADALRIDDSVLLPAEYPDTARLVARYGLRPVATPLSEFIAAEGGPTCLSILLEA